MRIIRTKKGFTVKYSKTKDTYLTWRKVKQYCENKVVEISQSKEAEEIKAIKCVIDILEKKVKSYNSKIALYKGMANTISETDPDIDKPFVTD